MDHLHGHHRDHDRDHRHALPSNRPFVIGVILNAVFVLVEAVFGVLSGSLALLADAGHNASDILGLLLAWGANMLQRRQATKSEPTAGAARPSWPPCSMP